jgi:arsenite/tail-anchored protein-transporting ATPase
LRLQLFTGKGGVGKTTIAAATAVHTARCGLRTLVLSTDAAHSLADVFGAPLGPDPRQLADGLFAQQVDARSTGDPVWRQIQEYLIGVFDSFGVEELLAEEIIAVPGVADLLALGQVCGQVRDGDWDLVVVDSAPTAETLRLLTLPETLAGILERALPWERKVMRLLAGAGTGRLDAPADRVVEAVGRLRAELTGLHEVLTAGHTSVRLVLTPETVALAEARRTWTSLALFGYRTDAVVVNRLVPPDGQDEWRRRRARAQQDRLSEIEESFVPTTVLRVLDAAVGPVGIDDLAEVGVELYGAAGPEGVEALLTPPGSRDQLRVERDGTDFVLRLDLPLAQRQEVDLTRLGDDLVVTVSGFRRFVSLPSALRRCQVSGARLQDGGLDIRFEPDPDQWRSW